VFAGRAAIGYDHGYDIQKFYRAHFHPFGMRERAAHLTNPGRLVCFAVLAFR
jgi:hypothetical protein